MIKRCIFAVCALVLIAACDPLTEAEQAAFDAKVVVDVKNDMSSYMAYVIDSRTGLCFVRSRTKGGYYVYTPIECTDKIMELVINKQR